MNLYNKTVLFNMFAPLTKHADLKTVINGPHPLFMDLILYLYNIYRILFFVYNIL